MTELYPWQEEFIRNCGDKKNIILSAPTGAGKTKVAYLWADIKRALRERSHRVFYTVPIKALANEKFKELEELFGDVGLVTGDVTIKPRAPVVMCTQEVFLKAFMKEKAKVIVDEFHYIFADQGRTRAYIDSSRCKSDMMVVSATMGDANKVADYLERISGKRFYVYATDFRPTRLEYTEKFFKLEELPAKSLIYIFNVNAAMKLAAIIAEYRRPILAKLLKIKRLANQFKVSNIESLGHVASGIAVYHGKLQYNEKLFIEEAVRRGLIDTIIATNALGVGVNLPVEWVLFAGFRMPADNGNFRQLSKTEFVQMAGRAGRPGYFDTGYVGCLVHNQNPYEQGEEIRKSYLELLKKPLEEPKIVLSPDVEGIVKGERTVEAEIQYIKNCSLPELDDYEISKIQEALYEIKLCISNLPPNVKETLRDTYCPELSIDSNVKLAETVSKSDSTVLTSSYVFSLTTGTEYQRLLITYRVCKRLRKIEYVYIDDFEALRERIQKIDPFILMRAEQQTEEVIL